MHGRHLLDMHGKKSPVLPLVLASMVFLLGCTAAPSQQPEPGENQAGATQAGETGEEFERDFTGGAQETQPVPERILQYDDLSDNEIMITNGVKHIVPLSELHQGCFGRDCIPSIDSPKFESVAKASEWLNENDTVLAIDYRGEQRVYPQRIMNWHEIVNDTIAGDPIVISFCPLCGSALAYERVIENEPVEFGVSGKLYNSDLVMYDRKTETYWGQIDGIGLVGPLTGVRLERVPIETVRWQDWAQKFPDTMVLSRDTGFLRDYGQYPYGNYESDSGVYFPVSDRDSRLHEKTIVHGIELNGKFKAYVEDSVEKGEIIGDEFAGEKLEIERTETGAFKIYVLNEQDERQERVVAVRNFWFAWFAFHPGTELYEG